MTKRGPVKQKECVICHKIFPTSISHKTTCSKECSVLKGKNLSKEWVKNNREKVNARSVKHRSLNLEKYRAYGRKRAAKNRRDNPRDVKSRKLKSTYGITLIELESILEKQHHKCAICKINFDYTSQAKGPHIDHDHKSGKLRMVLCRFCNNLLGYANDDISILKATISYLKRHND